MTSRATIIVIMTLFTQAICAPEVKGTMTKIAVTTLRSPADAVLSYKELLYILEVRNGDDGIKPESLSPCARAILGCCNEKVMNENCSEALNCGAFFFDVNPCEDKFVIDALSAARSFYEQINRVTR